MVPDLNLIPKFLSFEYGTWICWGFLCSFIFAFIHFCSPSFWRLNEQNLLRAQYQPWQVAQMCLHSLHNSGGHTAPQNFTFEATITKAMTFWKLLNTKAKTMGFSCRQDRCLQRVLTYFSLPIMQIPNALATHGQHSNAKCCSMLPHTYCGLRQSRKIVV